MGWRVGTTLRWSGHPEGPVLLLLVTAASAAPFSSYSSYSIDFDAVFTGIGDVNGDGYDDAAWNDPTGVVPIHMGGPGGSTPPRR